MTGQEQYDELLRAYKELQLRVTRFSVIEQELKNAYSQLDHELDLYKCLQGYSIRSLEVNTDEELMHLIAEAIIDILEIESSIIFYRDLNNAERSSLVMEGIMLHDSAAMIGEELIQLASVSEQKNSIRLSAADMEGCKALSRFSSGVIGMFREKELGYELFFLGAVTKINARLYGSLQDRHTSIFTVLAHQMQAVFANRKRNDMIETQIRKISESELELKKLSLIATKTKSGVIISDHYGRVEWVNEAFTNITGYELNEVIGRKPKDFLQGADTPEEKKRQLTEALSRKQDIELVTLNYDKYGRPYHSQLEVISVFDDQGRHTNFIGIQKDITDEVNYKQELLRINERYELIVNKVTNDIIWEWDFASDKISRGIGMSLILGYNRTDVDSDYAWGLNNIHPSDRQRVKEKIDHCISNKISNWQEEYRYRSADGSYKVMLDKGYIIFNESSEPYRMIGAMTDITERRELEKEILEQKISQQKLITQIALQVQEKEKTELGAELHDNINQILAVSKMYLGLYASKQNIPDRMLNTSREYIDKAIKEIRKLSHSLVTPSLGERDLMEAIRDLVSEQNMPPGISVDLLDDFDRSIQIADEKKLMFYRIVQEQINNIIKYANARNVTIHLKTDRDGINLSIEDDGVGFDTSVKTSGIGLKNIESRAQLHAGILKVHSAPGNGCRLEVYVPC